MLQHIAFDMGASSGKALLGQFDGQTLTMRDLSRFDNEPVHLLDRVYWDAPRLVLELQKALGQAVKTYGPIDTFGIDTWGTSCALIDENGDLTALPHHYRDSYFDGAVAVVEGRYPRADIRRMPCQIRDDTTLFQLTSIQHRSPREMAAAQRMLMMPDLLRYFLTGVQSSEQTILSTGALIDYQTKTWDEGMIAQVGLPRRLFGQIVPPGTAQGEVLPSIAEEYDLNPIRAVAVAEHDTASAVAAVTEDAASAGFLSCGTWALFGVQHGKAVMNKDVRAENCCNELCADGSVRFLKNIVGLWLYQECLREWQRAEPGLTHAALEQEAARCAPFASLIDVEDALFNPQGKMVRRIQLYCERSGQKVPQTRGEIVRCIYESLALKFKQTRQAIVRLTGHPMKLIQMVGGGSKSALLGQMTADALGVPVAVGLSDASAVGNVAMQLVGMGEVKDVKQAREVIARSFPVRYIAPQDTERWDAALETFFRVQKAYAPYARQAFTE